MKKYNPYIIVCLAAACLWSCTDPINDYYNGKNKGATGGTIVEGLENDPRFSEFLALLKETDRLDILSGSEDLMTVWAPVNGTAPEGIASMSLEEKTRLVENHISTSMIYSRNFDRLSRVKTILNKYLDVDAGEEAYTIDGAELVDPDRIHDNGIVHGISDWLVPRINIYEWLESAPQEYSMFRDSILSRNVLTFDAENSKVLGVDENGRIYYDTVWTVRNEILDAGDLREENARYSFFVPDNNALLQMMGDYTAWLEDIEYPVETPDTLMWYEWIMRASIYNGIADIQPGSSFRSVNQLELRIDYQRVASTSRFSNGVVYFLDKCYVSRNIYYSNVIFNPYYIRQAQGGAGVNTGLDNFNGIGHVVYKLDAASETFFLQYTVSNPFYWCKSYYYNEDEGLHPVKVMPGRYNVRGRLKNYMADNVTSQTDSVHVYINGEFVARVTGILSDQYDVENGGLLASDVEITGKYDVIEFEYKVPEPPDAGRPNRRLGPGRITLVPTDNY